MGSAGRHEWCMLLMILGSWGAGSSIHRGSWGSFHWRISKNPGAVGARRMIRKSLFLWEAAHTLDHTEYSQKRRFILMMMKNVTLGMRWGSMSTTLTTAAMIWKNLWQLFILTGSLHCFSKKSINHQLLQLYKKNLQHKDSHDTCDYNGHAILYLHHFPYLSLRTLISFC